MTSIGFDYMTPNRQLFRKSMAEALADLLGQRYRTAKQLAKAVGIDPATAENLYKGHLSVTTLQKVLAHEGRSLWDKLGEELYGETFYQFEERRIASAIREAELVRSNLVRLRSRSEELLSGASFLDPAAMGKTPDALGHSSSRAGPEASGAGDEGAEGARPGRPADTVTDRAFVPKTKGRP